LFDLHRPIGDPVEQISIVRNTTASEMLGAQRSRDS
jgi:hypothetical protein